MNGLETMGWNAHWDGLFAPFASAMIPGRVRLSSRDHFIVRTADGDLNASASGKLRLSGHWPATGDWVALAAARIEAVLHRRTAFLRREPGAATRAQILAANVDVAFLVMGLDHDYNLRRLERYLYLTAVSGARPVIVLNKSDLSDRLEERTLACQPLAPVVVLSALHGTGLGALTSHMAPGETAVLLGSSGAGKSTIANRLRGDDAIRTQPVRDHDSRGRHTTTHRELIPLSLGWLLMDVPGLRELQLWGAASGLDQTFTDVATLAEACRFRDCSHQGEPGCAVRAALGDGHLDEARWTNYTKLQREIAHLERSADPAALAAQKQLWKSIHKAQRKVYKNR